MTKFIEGNLTAGQVGLNLFPLSKKNIMNFLRLWSLAPYMVV